GAGGAGGESHGSSAGPASPSPTREPAPPSGGFSFDQFFSPAPEAAAGGPASVPKTSERGSGPRVRPPTPEDEGDLDQFQAWLRGLKS
ncbi:MAG TPA: hypothetical protein VJN39_13285, partial [Gemmatimonadales bacterium]|nr:hypothetical protein [Gemmatimonadales bacterium]